MATAFHESATSARPGRSWQKTQYANLIRYVPSGVYFARLRVGGKLIRKSLQTTAVSVAKLKLADLEKEERAKLEAGHRFQSGKALVADLIEEYRRRLEGNHTIKPRTRLYYEERLNALLQSWPTLPQTDARKVNPDDCERWAMEFAKRSVSSGFNNTVAVLRSVFQIGVDRGVRYSNPASGIKRAAVRPKQLHLPSQPEFQSLVAAMRSVPFGPGLAAADLVEFLAYGGFRKGEAAMIAWADCDFQKGEIIVRGDPDTGTKNGEVRRVPMIPDMRNLLVRLQRSLSPSSPQETVMRIRECGGSLARACRTLGLAKLTHHDLRHLFATRCIESGVDIPTVSRWLGHKDGGALAMRVYGHLRDAHSAEMAQRVRFAAA